MTINSPAEVLKKEQARAKREALELTLLHQLRALGLTDGLVQQHRFHPERQWRFDFAWPALRPAAAIISGWRVMRATTSLVKSGIASRWIMQSIVSTKFHR